MARAILGYRGFLLMRERPHWRAFLTVMLSHPRALVFLILLGLGTAVQIVRPTRTLAPGTVTAVSDANAVDRSIAWPLRLNAQGKYLEQQDGKPFLLVADAGWEFMTQLNEDEAIAYLDDRRTKGFNAVEIRVIGHKFQANAPNNFYNEPPFKNGSNDWSVRNEAYWTRAEALFSVEPIRGTVGGIDSYQDLVDINLIYAGDPAALTRMAYCSACPFMYQEGIYENEHGSTLVDIEAQALITYLY